MVLVQKVEQKILSPDNEMGGKILCFPSFEFVLGLGFISYSDSVLLNGKLKFSCDRGTHFTVPIWGENKKHSSKQLAIKFHQVMKF